MTKDKRSYIYLEMEENNINGRAERTKEPRSDDSDKYGNGDLLGFSLFLGQTL